MDFAWDLRGGSKILRILELAPCYDKLSSSITRRSSIRIFFSHRAAGNIQDNLSFLFCFFVAVNRSRGARGS